MSGNQAVHLYRACLRTAKRIPDPRQREIWLEYTKNRFHAKKNLTEYVKIRNAIREAEEQLESMNMYHRSRELRDSQKLNITNQNTTNSTTTIRTTTTTTTATLPIKKNRFPLYLAIALAGIGGITYKILTDEGFQRSTYFWSRMMPIYLHYRFVQWRMKNKSIEEENEAYEELHNKYAEKAVGVILKLKGFYIKIGQVASTRSDFLPHQYMNEVSKLQDSCPHESFDKIKNFTERSLGKKLEEVFTHFEKEPLGVASIGQVHRAVLVDGQEVAVKVMLPNVEQLFRGDMKTIKDFCRLVQPEHLPLMDEIEKQFMTEFDYRREANNMQQVRDNLMPVWNRKVIVPRPIFSTENVLIMEYLDGIKLVEGFKRHMINLAHARGMTVKEFEAEIKAREAGGEMISGPKKMTMSMYRTSIYLQDLVKNTGKFFYNYSISPVFRVPSYSYTWTELPLNIAAILDTMYQVHAYQIFVNGCFNGDPHPGNILLCRDGRLGLIDFGQVKRLGLKERILLAELILALAADDKEKIVSKYIEMGFRTKNMNPDIIYKHAKVIFDTDEQQVLGMNIQTYLEYLEKIDPVVSVTDNYVLAARVAILLRGLGYAFKYSVRTSLVWENICRKFLKDNGRQP